MFDQFITHEIQGTSDTPYTFQVADGEDPDIAKNQAMAKFHSIMVVAYGSNVPYHGAYIVHMVEATPGRIDTFVIASEIRKREVTA